MTTSRYLLRYYWSICLLTYSSVPRDGTQNPGSKKEGKEKEKWEETDLLPATSIGSGRKEHSKLVGERANQVGDHQPTARSRLT